MVMGKHKGSKWENKIYDDVRDRGVFIRKNKGSGNASDNKGDLETINLLIECKHYKKVTDKQVKMWFAKILKEALEINKFPILIVKENYQEPQIYFTANKTGKKIVKTDYKLWLQEYLVTEDMRTDLFEVISVKNDKEEIDEKPSYIG